MSDNNGGGADTGASESSGESSRKLVTNSEVAQTFEQWARTLEGYGVELELGASVLDDWRNGSRDMPHPARVACVEGARHLRAAAESLVRAQVELGKVDAIASAAKAAQGTKG